MNAIFDALAHPTRRRILEILRNGGMGAGDLADLFPVSKPTMSAHFAKLKAAGLIQSDSKGTSVTYTLNLSVLEEALMGFMGRLNVGVEQRQEETEQ